MKTQNFQFSGLLLSSVSSPSWDLSGRKADIGLFTLSVVLVPLEGSGMLGDYSYGHFCPPSTVVISPGGSRRRAQSPVLQEENHDLEQCLSSEKRMFSG